MVGRLPWFVGEGHAPPASLAMRRGPRADMESAPTEVCGAAGGIFPVGCGPSGGCRGGIYPSRGRSRRRKVRGTISGLRAGPAARLASETRLRAQCEHRPLQGLQRGGGAFSRLAAVFARPCRAGVHARRTLAISKNGALCRRGVRRDGGIPPYGRPDGGGHPVWLGVCHGL